MTNKLDRLSPTRLRPYSKTLDKREKASEGTNGLAYLSGLIVVKGKSFIKSALQLQPLSDPERVKLLAREYSSHLKIVIRILKLP